MDKKPWLSIAAVLVLVSLACSAVTLPFNQSSAPDAASPAQGETPSETAPPQASPAAASNNPCNNVLYPLVPGQQMVYKIDAEGETSQLGLTVSSVDGSQATVDMLDMATGIVTQSTIDCEEGAIKQFPLVTMSTLFGDIMNGSLKMEYIAGLIAPSEATFVANNWDMGWESQYIMNGNITVEDEGDTLNILIDDSPVTMKWQTAGTGETVTVAAGTYTNVVKVTREMTMEVSIDAGGMAIKGVILISSTHWFEPYIGMVKMQIDSASMQYQGMTFPITMNENMELVEFRPAQ